MAKRSPDKLLKLLESRQVVEFKDVQSALDNASRATCFRYLSQVPYHRSYNYNVVVHPLRLNTYCLWCEDV